MGAIARGRHAHFYLPEPVSSPDSARKPIPLRSRRPHWPNFCGPNGLTAKPFLPFRGFDSSKKPRPSRVFTQQRTPGRGVSQRARACGTPKITPPKGPCWWVLLPSSTGCMAIELHNKHLFCSLGQSLPTRHQLGLISKSTACSKRHFSIKVGQIQSPTACSKSTLASARTDSRPNWMLKEALPFHLSYSARQAYRSHHALKNSAKQQTKQTKTHETHKQASTAWALWLKNSIRLRQTGESS